MTLIQSIIHIYGFLGEKVKTEKVYVLEKLVFGLATASILFTKLLRPLANFGTIKEKILFGLATALILFT